MTFLQVSAFAQDLPQVANATKFSEPKILPTSLDDTPVELATSDIDGDGDVDLIWISRGDNLGTDAIMWNENLGGGEFGNSRVIDADFEDPRALVVGDLNGDGLDDVVAGSDGMDRIQTYLNTGEQGQEPTPISVSDVVQQSSHTAILTAEGQVVVIGCESSSGILQVPDFDTTVVAIEGSGSSTGLFVAKLVDGTSQAWGNNNCGVLQAIEGTTWSDLILGTTHYAIGLKSDSTLFHVGCSNYDVDVVPEGSDFVGIWGAPNDNYWAGAIRANGSVEMWGNEGSYGTLEVPVDLGPIAFADGGDWWTLALAADSTLRAWGRDEYGVVSNVPDLTDVVAIAAGGYHGLALTASGTVHAWGRNNENQVSLPVFDAPVVKIGSGYFSSWAQTETGRTYFWGYNNCAMTAGAQSYVDGIWDEFGNGVSDDRFNLGGTVYEGGDVQALALADVDGDGDLDVVSGGCDQVVAWYENDGAGNFAGDRMMLAQDIQCIRGVMAVDLDLDGDADVVTFTANGQLSWFENIAQGNFGPQMLIDDTWDGWGVASGDVNADGYPDLFVKKSEGCFRWYRNPGAEGEWSMEQEQCPPEYYPSDRSFWVGDIVGDDGIDVVTSSYAYREMSLEISVNRNGHFDETYSALSLPDMAYGYGQSGQGGIRGLAVADLDGDGDMDLVATDRGGDRVFWLAQEPSTAPTTLRTSVNPDANNVQSLAHGDVDGDGDLDLVATNAGTGTVEMYLNNGGSFDPPLALSTLDGRRVQMADINNDGALDVLVAGGTSNRVEFVPGNGDGTFGTPHTISTQVADVWGVASADLDNDGDLDVVTASREDDKFAWYKNLGNGNFGPQQILTILIDQPIDVATSDVDQDGDMDIVGVSIEGGERLVWFKNQGGGLFSQYIQIADMAGDPYRIHLADVNGDGFEDAMVSNGAWYHYSISYWPNEGNGNWGNEVIVTNFAHDCRDLCTADLDLDGDLDVFSASAQDDKVAWYENLGDGVFGMQQPFTIGRTNVSFAPSTRGDLYQCVVAFDADGDGDVDVLSASQNGGVELYGNLTGAAVGCGDVEACNYDAEASAEYGCQYDCYGCTQSESQNYNPEATLDDGQCLIPIEGCGVSGTYTLCTGNGVDTILTFCPENPENSLQLTLLGGALETMADYLYVYDGPDTTAVLIGEPLTGSLVGSHFEATNPDGCLTLRVVTDVSLSCSDGFFDPVKYLLGCGYLDYMGCMDETACNFNPEALIEDGSCTTEDCLGVCGGPAVQDGVCDVCIDLAYVSGLLGDFESAPGPTAFVKENYASNDSANWDFVTDDVAIFRNNNQGLFNALMHSSYQNGTVAGTMWGPGATTDLSLFDDNWRDLQCSLYGDCSYSCYLPGHHQTLYIESTGEFFDIHYVSWTCGNEGGGFSYIRTPIIATVDELDYVENGLQSSVTFDIDTVKFGYTDNIETWNVPAHATYLRIEARGASGGTGGAGSQRHGGLGTRISGLFGADTLSVLQVLVGEAGSTWNFGASGGGGSFVAAGEVPLVVAGGGSGGAEYEAGRNGVLTALGGGGSNCGEGSLVGQQGTDCGGRAGYGFVDAFLAGGRGESTNTFGGGDKGSNRDGGGGGGYSGGNGTLNSGRSGGGGGSFNAGQAQINDLSFERGHGEVTIVVYSVIGANCSPGCQDSGACNFDPLAAEDDGSCEYMTCEGCMDEGACNFDESASISDMSQCEYYTCLGCMDEEACNFDESASIDAADCIYPSEHRDCEGNCFEDSDGDGVCDGEEILGCTYPQASNYNPFATEENGSCLFDGTTDIFGCIYPGACNFNPAATADDGSCSYAAEGYDCSGMCIFDTDGDGICNQFEGCTNTLACNYDPQALDNDGTCVFPPVGYDCEGGCLYDSDGDGICDNFEFPGCTDVEACNYYQGATDDDGSCSYAEYGYDCAGYCLGDVDNDGVCDLNEIEGCTLLAACNYNPEATDNDGSCLLAPTYYSCDGNCQNDTDNDGVCDELEVAGCSYMEADNFNPDATDDDGSCTFYELYGLEGCTDVNACNFDLLATTNDGSCTYPSEGYDCEGNCLADDDGDGICNVDDPDFVGAGYCGEGTFWDSESQTCIPNPSCFGDINNDQMIDIIDLLDLLSAFGGTCQ